MCVFVGWCLFMNVLDILGMGGVNKRYGYEEEEEDEWIGSFIVRGSWKGVDEIVWVREIGWVVRFRIVFVFKNLRNCL